MKVSTSTSKSNLLIQSIPKTKIRKSMKAACVVKKQKSTKKSVKKEKKKATHHRSISDTYHIMDFHSFTGVHASKPNPDVKKKYMKGSVYSHQLSKRMSEEKKSLKKSGIPSKEVTLTPRTFAKTMNQMKKRASPYMMVERVPENIKAGVVQGYLKPQVITSKKIKISGHKRIKSAGVTQKNWMFNPPQPHEIKKGHKRTNTHGLQKQSF